jgi:RNA polymerase sigma-70 factor (ECF subfamily)
VDSELIERARSGDVMAFEALVDARLDGMLRTATAIVGDVETAREATQDTLIAIWRELPTLRSLDRFDAWAGRILINRCRLLLRRGQRQRSRETTLEAVDQPRLDSQEALGARLALEVAFERLDANERALLVLHHLDGLELQEIAAHLEIPVGTAKSRLFAAWRSLQRHLDAGS